MENVSKDFNSGSLNQAPDPSSVSAWPTAMRYGLIGGLLSIVLSIISSFLGWNVPGNSMSALIAILGVILLIGILVLGIKTHRDGDLGGFISLGRCITVGLQIALVMGVIGALYSFVYQTFIDPDMMNTVMEAQRTQLEDRGLTDEQIDQALGFSKMFSSPGLTALFSLISTIIFSTILSLIVGLFLKNENPYA